MTDTMMRNMKENIKENIKRRLLPCAAALSLSLSACEHKELCYDHPHTVSLNVIFDWTDAPDAEPASMSLYLFPQGEDGHLRYEFTGRDGGTISVPPGTYDAICLNSDTEGIVYRNTGSYGTFELSTQTTDLVLVSGSDGTGDGDHALTPDRLWTGTKEDIELLATEPESEITLRPVLAVRTCRVEITDVENLEQVSWCVGVLSNMTDGYLPGAGTYTDDHAAHPFDLWAGADGTTLEGEFHYWHHCVDPDGGIVHPLVVHAVLSDGSVYSHVFEEDEVTWQLHEDHDHHAYEVVLRLSGLRLPEPIPGSGGFQPTVEDWEDVDIGIEM